MHHIHLSHLHYHQHWHPGVYLIKNLSPGFHNHKIIRHLFERSPQRSPEHTGLAWIVVVVPIQELPLGGVELILAKGKIFLGYTQTDRIRNAMKPKHKLRFANSSSIKAYILKLYWILKYILYIYKSHLLATRPLLDSLCMFTAHCKIFTTSTSLSSGTGWLFN